MSDEQTPTTDQPERSGVDQIDLQTEMKRSYLDYAMAVIVGRALPDVRDGLKPVHRRVIYAMFDGGYRPERSFNKSARPNCMEANDHNHTCDSKQIQA